MPEPHRPGPSRRPLFEHPWRIVIVLGALLVVVNLGVILLANSDTSTTTERTLPSSIESVAPEPGTVAQLQAPVSVDLRDGLTGVLVINGAEIPEDQLERGEALGIVTFRPDSDKDFTRWNAGDVAVRVLSWPAAEERPTSPDAYSWSFRASA